MDEELYKEIYKKILNNENIQTGSKFEKYKIEEGILYRKDQKNNGKILKVIRRHELEIIMFIMHDHPTSAHFAIETTFNKI